LGQHILTPSGHVKIEPTLQVKGYPRIFAAGDIIDFDEQKQAAKAMYGHMPVVKANILALTGGSAPSKVYKGSTELLVIVTGRVRERPMPYLYSYSSVPHYRVVACSTLSRFLALA
jgi:apoptosis-inducing factor 2